MAKAPALLLREVGARIAELRRERGLTQAGLAELAGVGEHYIRMVELGRENLSLRSLTGLAGVLGVEVVDLFTPPQSMTTRRGRPPRQKAGE